MAVKCILTGQTPSVLDGVTENVQTQLNDKVDKVTGKGLSTNDYTSAEKTKLSGIETGAQKNTITGVKGSAETTYRTGNVNITATNIGLGNVDNTSDANKPISNATQAALNDKQSKITANGFLKGDGTGTITAADETEVELVDLPQEVFWATYGETTYAEIKTAYDGQKVILVKDNMNNVYSLGALKNNQFDFALVRGADDVGTQVITCSCNSSGWSSRYVNGYYTVTALYISLDAASWTGSDPYTQTIASLNGQNGVQANIQLSDILYDQLVADGVTYLNIENNDGIFTAKAKGGKPSVDLTVQVSLIRGSRVILLNPLVMS